MYTYACLKIFPYIVFLPFSLSLTSSLSLSLTLSYIRPEAVVLLASPAFAAALLASARALLSPAPPLFLTSPQAQWHRGALLGTWGARCGGGRRRGSSGGEPGGPHPFRPPR